MKKSVFLLLACFCLSQAYSQLLYSSSTNLSGAGTNPGLGANGTPVIVMDDVQIASSRIGTSDTIAVTLLKFAIQRSAGAAATTASFYVSSFEDTATLLNNVFKVPTLIGTLEFPANGSAAQNYVIKLGDSVRPLFKMKADTGNFVSGYQTFFAGVSFSQATGSFWLATQGGNLDMMWTYDADKAVNSRRAVTKFGGDPAPSASLYLQVFGYGIERTLPVSLISFTGSNINDGVLLAWKTASEYQNKGFYIERSADGSSFANIGYTAGKGTSNTGSSYVYTDKNPLPGKSYYRLKQVDLDGNATYSSIVDIDWANDSWVAYPNPTQGAVNLSLDIQTPSQVSVQLIGMDGKIYQTVEKGKLASGNHRLILNPPAKGLYRVKLIVGSRVYYKTISKF